MKWNLLFNSYMITCIVLKYYAIKLIFNDIDVIKTLISKTIIRLQMKLEKFMYILKISYEFVLDFLNPPGIYIMLASKLHLPASFVNLFTIVLSSFSNIQFPFNSLIIIFQS